MKFDKTGEKRLKKMFSTKRKRSRAKNKELPKRFRCRDKYNRALNKEMANFVSKEEKSGETCGGSEPMNNVSSQESSTR